MAAELTIRPMIRTELDILVEWAAAEGWNPGLNDAQIFWDTDPEGFIAADRHGELIGGGSIVAYGARFGFMGFFIVRPEYRRQGLGRPLWQARRDRLIARLQPPAVLGMDGVFAMQDFYARGGFVLSHRDLRFAGVGVSATLDTRLVELAQIPFMALARYDAADVVLMITCTASIAATSTNIELYRRDLNSDGTADTKIPDASNLNKLVAVFKVPAATTVSTTNYMVEQDVPLSGGDCEFYLKNALGVNVLAGWTLKVTPKTDSFA